MYKETIIIGAGPAGIQLGYFLQKDNYDYIIFERNDKAGSFFKTFPHIGKLISINKKYTGYSDPDFNLRHDWNSLLSENGPLFTSYSDDYYPKRDDLYNYLNDFANEHLLSIQYKTNVVSIQQYTNIQNESRYKILINCNDIPYEYICKNIVIATGLSPRIPKNIKVISDIPILHYGQYEKDYFLKESTLLKFVNKSLAIIGDGNSAMELANHFIPFSSTIIVFGKERDSNLFENHNNHKISLSTNYTGDVRALYLGFYDTFVLKSLNAIDHIPCHCSIIKNDNNTFSIINNENGKLITFDHIIFATGWEFDSSIFSFESEFKKKGNLPDITPEYESTSHQGLYFIGSISHSLDLGKSSGGFIHGFRYMIRYFYQLHYKGEFIVEYYKTNNNYFLETSIKLFTHLNKSSAMYQMHGMIGTIFYKEDDNIKCLLDVSIHLYHYTVRHNHPINVNNKTYVFILTLEYGEKKNQLIHRIGLKESITGKEYLSKLIHPVLRIYKNQLLIKTYHFDEDLLAMFINDSIYANRLNEILLEYLL
jgi:hypothetical protein